MQPIDLSRLKRESLKDRPSKENMDDWAEPVELSETDRFLASLSKAPGVEALIEIAKAVAFAHAYGHPVILGYGAHVIKTGLSPLIADLIKRNIVTAVITNGAGAIHELEFVLAGKTSEDVDKRLPEGTFGMAEETAKKYQEAIWLTTHGEELGLGLALGSLMVEENYDRAKQTVLGAAVRYGAVPGVFVAMGTDIVHMHEEFDPAQAGLASHRDFRILCSIMEKMGVGVFINMGSAVILPEVFLKATAVAINVGADLRQMVTANMDMSYHYRPTRNVVERPPGKGYQLIGHHEIMLPLLRLVILNAIETM